MLKYPVIVLFSIDIDSLYTNIETSLGLIAIQDIFKQHPDPARPDKELLQLLHITLTRNDFSFNNKYYLQLCGCAMGRKYSPAYADIYLAHWERAAFTKLQYKPLIYFRYLDDIFGVWDHTEEQFHTFLDTLNAHHPKIKLKHNLQHLAVEFLDTIAFFRTSDDQTKTLATKVYFKDTDRHALLHKSSYHPKHTYRGLIKSQLIRFHRICTLPAHVEEATVTLFKALRSRGYSRRFLRTIKAEVAESFRSGDSNQQPPTQSLVPLVLTYNSCTHKFLKTVKQNFQGTRERCAALEDTRVISAFRRNKNLKDFLVHTNLNKKENKKEASRESEICFIRLPHIFNPQSRIGYNIGQVLRPIDCNVIYAIRCGTCHKLYVGETKNELHLRIKQHFNLIKSGKGTSVLYNHFKLHGSLGLHSLGLEGSRQWSTTQRQAAERRWIHRLGTIDPFGLNEKY